ncbi:MAG: GAF domain-containing protein [Coriobacteriales bacterium]|nr:GAF domain-containing protein [Coriobacteriales bacterium]
MTYELLEAQVRALCDDQPHWMAGLANVAAHMAEALDQINWVGFYLRGSFVDPTLDDDVLILGPFAGKVACARIPFGKGVCGTAALRDQTLRVDDVHSFAGHIACDAASASELVVPLHAGGSVVGVLDIDSPIPSRFDAADQAGLEAVARAIDFGKTG